MARSKKGKRTFQPNNRRRAKTHGFLVRMATKDGRQIYRVRIGPFQNIEQADEMLLRVQELGHNDVQIVVEAQTS